MKKTLALILCLMLVMVSALAFASCDKKGDDESKTEAPTESTTETNAATEAPTQTESVSETEAASETETVTETDAATGTETETEIVTETVTETETETETDAVTETETDAATGTETEAVTDAETATETVTETETEEETEPEYDPELYVLIRTAEDLMKFNEEVNSGDEDHCYKTVLFMNDIDMTGYTWTPLDGFMVEGITFDGQNHTISNLTFADFDPEIGTAAGDMGSGFIGVNQFANTFMNLTFDNVKVTAYERHVGCIVGINNCSTEELVCENVHVKNFTVDGWADYNNTDRNNGGHPISFRIGGFIGHNMVGWASFKDCSATDLNFTGFHNLSGFVGYDGSGNIDENCFDNCTVADARFTFSYCLSTSYTVDMPRKFVSVFYCANNWADNVDYVCERGNYFENVIYIDWVEGGEYFAEEFRSWTREEAAA